MDNISFGETLIHIPSGKRVTVLETWLDEEEESPTYNQTLVLVDDGNGEIWVSWDSLGSEPEIVTVNGKRHIVITSYEEHWNEEFQCWQLIPVVNES